MGLAVTKVNSKRRGPTSARKGATPALSKEYQTVFETTGKAMVIVEEDATISLANAEFEKLSGYTRKEIEGKKSWTGFVARNDRKRVREYHRLRKTDPMLAPRSFEFRFLDRHETVKNVVLTIGQIPGTNKSMASLLDITDRRRDEKQAHGGNTASEERLKNKTAELIEANEALQAEVADLKRKVETLREIDERNRTLIDNIDLGINLIDIDHNIIMVNAAGSKQINKPVSELIGKKCFREFEKRDSVCPHCPGVQTITTGKFTEVETEGIRDDGSRLTVRIQTHPAFGHDGAMKGFVEIVEDISEHKRMEEKLRESEERFRTLVQNVKLGINLIDSNHNIVMVSAGGTKQIDKSESKLIGKKCFREFEKRDAVCPHCPGIQTLATGKPAEAETEGVRDNGSRYNVRIQTFPVFDQDGTVTSFIEVVEDITERKLMEKQLEQAENRYRTLVETMKVGLTAIDRKGVHTYANEQFCRMLGYSMDEVIGSPTIDFQDEESRKRQEETFAKRRRGIRDPAPYEITWVAKDGHKVHTILTPTARFNAEGHYTGSFAIMTDITERKRTEEALKESEERFRMLAENTPFAISVMAPDGIFEYFNPRFTEIFGYTKEDIPDKDTWFKKAYPDEEYRKKTISTWKRDIAEDIRLGEENPRVFTVRCKDGQDKIIDFKIVYSNDGKIYLTYRDITDRVKAEETLRESEERYRALVENVNLGINLIDADHTILSINAGQSGYFEKSRSETIGKKCYQEFEKRDAVCPHCPGVQTLATGQPAETETVGVRDDGSRFNARLQTFPVFGDDGTVTSFIEVVEDITERKQMEQALRQTEDRYRTLVETMQVGLSSIDEKGVLTYVNEQFCKMLGYSMDELIGRLTVDFYYDEEARKAQEKVFAKREEGFRDSPQFEIAWRTKDGRRIYTILSPTPRFDADGHFTGSSAIQTDITERKQMEERLQRYAAELERSNEEVKNFAYIVSHDLRVPLVNLKGYTTELQSALEVIGPNMDTALPHLDEDKRSAVAMALHEDVPEALEFITTSVSRMDSFINAVLQLSRFGRRDLKPEPIDMNALVQTSLETLAHRIQERGIKVTVESLPQVVADRTAMEQIMGNILGNAVKYLDPERPGQIEVTAKNNHSETIFRIQDNGRGIAEEDMHKVFAPFRRAGKQDTPGEGMGLAYVQTLVRRHNGRIWCESEFGKGTTMTFTISPHQAAGGDHVAH